jgi:nucleotide-binding universal stress UspA family protein
MPSNILVPVDTTYASTDWLKQPLAIATDLARRSGGTVHLISVVPDNLLKGSYPDVYSDNVAKEVRQRLDEIAKQYIPSDVTVKSEVRRGGICSEVLRAVREIGVNEIVIASHGPVLKDYLIGSNASHIALHAPCSVHVIRDQAA